MLTHIKLVDFHLLRAHSILLSPSSCIVCLYDRLYLLATDRAFFDVLVFALQAEAPVPTRNANRLNRIVQANYAQAFLNACVH